METLELLSRIKIPRNQTAVMSLLLQYASNGYCYYAQGVVAPAKLGNFVTKLGGIYPIALDKVARSLQRKRGQAAYQLVVLPDDEIVRWVLLSTPGSGNLLDRPLDAGMKVRDLRLFGERLRWKQYELLREPKSWQDRTSNGKPITKTQRTWSWRLIPERVKAHEAHIVACARNHNRPALDAEVKALSFMPMFAQVRRQVAKLWKEADKVWRKFNGREKAEPLTIPPLFYLRKIKIYSTPALSVLGFVEQWKGHRSDSPAPIVDGRDEELEPPV